MRPILTLAQTSKGTPGKLPRYIRYGRHCSPIDIESIEQALPFPNELIGREQRKIPVLGARELIGRQAWIGSPVSTNVGSGLHN